MGSNNKMFTVDHISQGNNVEKIIIIHNYFCLSVSQNANCRIY